MLLSPNLPKCLMGSGCVSVSLLDTDVPCLHRGMGHCTSYYAPHSPSPQVVIVTTREQTFTLHGSWMDPETSSWICHMSIHSKWRLPPPGCTFSQWLHEGCVLMVGDCSPATTQLLVSSRTPTIKVPDTFLCEQRLCDA